MANKKKAAPKTEAVNKTQEVKDYMAKNPDAEPKQVVEALAANGIEITSNYVSNIKSKSGKAAAPKKQVRKRGRKLGAAVATGGGLSAKLADAIATIKSAGGLDEAEKALGIIKRLEG